MSRTYRDMQRHGDVARRIMERRRWRLLRAALRFARRIIAPEVLPESHPNPARRRFGRASW